MYIYILYIQNKSYTDVTFTLFNVFSINSCEAIPLTWAVAAPAAFAHLKASNVPSSYLATKVEMNESPEPCGETSLIGSIVALKISDLEFMI